MEAIVKSISLGRLGSPEEITKVVMKITGNQEESVSVSIEDVEQQDWTEVVYNTDIKNNWDKLYKKPGYKPV